VGRHRQPAATTRLRKTGTGLRFCDNAIRRHPETVLTKKKTIHNHAEITCPTIPDAPNEPTVNGFARRHWRLELKRFAGTDPTSVTASRTFVHLHTTPWHDNFGSFDIHARVLDWLLAAFRKLSAEHLGGNPLPVSRSNNAALRPKRTQNGCEILARLFR